MQHDYIDGTTYSDSSPRNLITTSTILDKFQIWHHLLEGSIDIASRNRKYDYDAYLINVADGAMVNAADLLTLFQSSHPAVVTLDLLTSEPLPAPRPF